MELLGFGCSVGMAVSLRGSVVEGKILGGVVVCAPRVGGFENRRLERQSAVSNRGARSCPRLKPGGVAPQAWSLRAPPPSRAGQSVGALGAGPGLSRGDGSPRARHPQKHLPLLDPLRPAQNAQATRAAKPGPSSYPTLDLPVPYLAYLALSYLASLYLTSGNHALPF